MATSLGSACSVFRLTAFLVLLSFSGRPSAGSDPPLTLDYYAKSCPEVLKIVRKEMECAVLSDPRNAALTIQLHFHDCFVQVRLTIKSILCCYKITISRFLQVLKTRSSDMSQHECLKALLL